MKPHSEDRRKTAIFLWNKSLEARFQALIHGSLNGSGHHAEKYLTGRLYKLRHAPVHPFPLSSTFLFHTSTTTMLASSTMMFDARPNNNAARRTSFSSFVRHLFLLMTRHHTDDDDDDNKKSPSSTTTPSDDELFRIAEEEARKHGSLFLEMYISFPALDDPESETNSINHCSSSAAIASQQQQQSNFMVGSIC